MIRTLNNIRLLAGFTLVALIGAQDAQAQKIPSQVVESIKFREIGPTRQGGRYVDFAVVDDAPKVMYAATASGGLWKTVNNGQSWNSLFDQ